MNQKTMPVEMTDEKARWLEERRGGIGGSDAPVIMGLSLYKTTLQLYCEKLGIGETPNVSSEAAEWGILLEDPIAQKYQRETGRLLFNPGPFTIQRNKDYPYATCTIDRFVLEGPGTPGSGWGVLQIKTTSAMHEEDWGEGAPPHVYCQVQHEMAVTGCTWGSVAVLIGGQKFRWCDVDRDDAYIADLMAKEKAFWQRILALDPPEPEAGDRDTIARMYPQDSGAIVELSGHFLGRDEELLIAKGQLSELKIRVDLLENRIKAAIGEASVGVLPNGVKYTYKTQARKEYVCPASSFRVLRRSAK